MHTPPFRIGFGYDVHRLVPGRPLILGGVTIPHHLGLLGHSDADVLLHALTDALLGALALRDIGFHFPDTDPRYKGADSLLLLRDAYRLVRKEGWLLANADCTLVAERPKINPHIPLMQERIAHTLEVEPGQISIKATTHEQMDAFGREEGIGAYATALIYPQPQASL
ncbi:MAG: 2-C-methyl-D-erythritol 2,4-cyclodiphosphate synthase [Bacteroidetes bacterium]|nr:2-C-methyl-D-erythritol 2,4-cyclodiphosphate synthase [Bacteroidota bacterium]